MISFIFLFIYSSVDNPSIEIISLGLILPEPSESNLLKAFYKFELDIAAFMSIDAATNSV